MCLTITDFFKTKKDALTYSKNPKIATKNIIVYKLLNVTNGEYKSPYFKMIYKPEDIIETNKFTFVVDNLSTGEHRLLINQGIHSYEKKNCLSVSLRKLIWENCSNNNGTLIKCVIPKGTPYFINAVGEVVSLKLIMPTEFKHHWD
jgi:hypothetical protein